MKTELLSKLESEFKAAKKELNFKADLEEIDKLFYIRDYVQDKGYVSTSITRMICSRVVDLYMSWYGYLHSLLMPNPQSILNVSESQLFGEEERRDIQQLMSGILALTSRNGIIGLTKDKKAQAQFVDDSVKAWHEMKPKLVSILEKVNSSWVDKSKNPPKPPKRSNSFG